jgi:hypothetical protein
MGYPQKGYYGGNKTDATGFLWAAHLANLLIDSVYSGSRLWGDLKRGGDINYEVFQALRYNFKELFESTKTYMPKDKLNEMGLEDLFKPNGQIDKELTYDDIAKITELFFKYNTLIHESKIMKIIEEARVWVDSGT